MQLQDKQKTVKHGSLERLDIRFVNIRIVDRLFGYHNLLFTLFFFCFYNNNANLGRYEKIAGIESMSTSG